MSILNIFANSENFGETNNNAKIFMTNNPNRPNMSEKLQSLQINSFETVTETAVHRQASTPVPTQAVVEGAERPPGDDRLRVMFCGTYPIGQSNGYSRVVYYISKHLGLKKDIKLTIYGFQNYQQTHGSDQRNDIPSDVVLHDAMATEEPRRNGFGEKEIGTYLRQNPQDIVIIFNDSVITSALASTIIQEFSEEERKRFLLVSYMDQVYPYQRHQYIQLINQYFDVVIAFTPYWRQVARRLGVKKEIPMYFFPHGFDTETYFPINKTIARAYYNLPDDAFVILNLNRNQPRKRWDHTLMAFADLVKRHQDLIKKAETTAKKLMPRPLRLMVATAADGYWNMLDVFDFEVRKHGIDVQEARNYIVFMSKPQQMSDKDINILYNACDIGLNTCEGEGFGLCQFEHLGVGCPQVSPNIGGMREFLNSGNSITVEAKWSYHVDKNRDGIGGVAEIADVKDYADAIWKYYNNPALVFKHGAKGRSEILTNYRWEDMVDYFHKILKDIAKKNEGRISGI